MEMMALEAKQLSQYGVYILFWTNSYRIFPTALQLHEHIFLKYGTHTLANLKFCAFITSIVASSLGFKKKTFFFFLSHSIYSS
jgi:hypothetical protein